MRHVGEIHAAFEKGEFITNEEYLAMKVDLLEHAVEYARMALEMIQSPGIFNGGLPMKPEEIAKAYKNQCEIATHALKRL